VIKFKRPRSFHALAGKYEKEMRRAVRDEMKLGLDLMLEALDETPVYTGRTLANYRFSTGSPIEGARPPVARPTLPGKTSEMEVGSEPRRSANMQLVLEEWRSVKNSVEQNPYQTVYMVNNTPYFLEVEFGTYRTSEGHSQRTPAGGMVRRVEFSIANMVKK
jgi:hypothetical protein